MNIDYKKFFGNILSEEINEPQVPSDEEQWKNTFEDPSMADEFMTEPSMPGNKSRYVDMARDWLAKIDEMKQWLNGDDNSSLVSMFNRYDKEGSPLEGISKKADVLTKISAELGSLEEIIKGQINTALNKLDQPVDQEAMVAGESVDKKKATLIDEAMDAATKAGKKSILDGLLSQLKKIETSLYSPNPQTRLDPEQAFEQGKDVVVKFIKMAPPSDINPKVKSKMLHNILSPDTNIHSWESLNKYIANSLLYRIGLGVTSPIRR